MKELRGYQSQGAVNGCNILKMHNILYMAWSVRTGKTATSMEVCRLFDAKEVLFLTKKKAIKNIEEDYRDFGFDNHFNITVTNNESMHKIENPSKFDVVIHDESHRFGSLAKPNTGAKLFKKLFSGKPIILLSGTPSPESFSQMYHQLPKTQSSRCNHSFCISASSNQLGSYRSSSLIVELQQKYQLDS